MNAIVKDRDERLKMALRSQEKTLEQLQVDVNIIKEWLKNQKHLPEMPHDHMIQNFLLLNKFSIEATKQKLDMYYTLRGVLPEVFENKHPNLPHMQQNMKAIYIFMLPKLTDDGNSIAVMRIASENSNILELDPYMIFAHMYNVVEVRLHEDVALGDICIYDMAYFPIRQIARLNPVLMRKGTIPLEKIYSSRVKAIHILHAPGYAEPLIKLIRQLLNPKLAERIHIHDSVDGLKKFLPNNVLPKDYGGDLPPLQEINESWMKAFEKYSDRFDTIAKLKVNEQLRPEPLVNDDILGVYGNFKKLNVD
ncbi:unnamed protein product [Acanthoscelides obtectus]|uniref:CRAL-TRIO domain-containing protein n=1 Tax=Acanthoscelides obtectus TaxID=200917 RepID=A0A9P0LSN7_ACAOB|nr:unnamed protein product [Acanthoscelides obtectus]CAK1659649.1 Retinaldehyde-binding protein 1 [Acanthoscelides obtectus]